jgi:hypothetical protein
VFNIINCFSCSFQLPLVVDLEDCSRILDLWIINGPKGELRLEAVKRIRNFLNNPGQSTLNLCGLKLTELPPELFKIPDLVNRLKDLDLSYNQLTQLPDTFGNLSQLTTLNLVRNELTQLPDTFGNLRQLTKLNLRMTELTQLPSTFGNLSQLADLKLDYNDTLTQLPDTFGRLTALTDLSLNDSNLAHLPDTFGNLRQLTTLNLSSTKLAQLPDTFGNLSQLTTLFLSSSQLAQLPDTFGNLTGLQLLSLGHNLQLTQLPSTLGNLSRLQLLELNDNPQLTIPSEILRLPQTCRISLRGTPISPAIRKFLQQLASTKGYQGPRIDFSGSYTNTKPSRYKYIITSALPLEKSFEKLEKHIKSKKKKNIFWDQTYTMLQKKCSRDAQFKLNLESWLSRLFDLADDICEGESSEQPANKIVDYLILASNDESFFREFKAIIESSVKICDNQPALSIDRATLSLLHIGIQYAVATFDKSDVKGFANLLKDVLAIQILERVGGAKAETLPFANKIEVRLGYPIRLKKRLIQLREKLELPIDANRMLFFSCSCLTQEDLDAVAAEVENVFTDEKQLHASLISFPEWIKVLKTELPEECKAIDAEVDKFCVLGEYEKADEMRKQLYIALSQKLLPSCSLIKL